jgi:hypothetical protein
VDDLRVESGGDTEPGHQDIPHTQVKQQVVASVPTPPKYSYIVVASVPTPPKYSHIVVASIPAQSK